MATTEAIERAEQHILDAIADFQQAIREATTADEVLSYRRRLEALELQIGQAASRAVGKAYELHR